MARFVQQPQTAGDLCTIEQAGRQSEHCLHQAVADNALPDLPLRPRLARQSAVGQKHGGAAFVRHVADDVLQPRKVCVGTRRRSVLPERVGEKADILAPMGEIERRVRQNKVKSPVGVQILCKSVGGPAAQIGKETLQKQVHTAQLVGPRVRRLAV